jgi:predicted molibdopterin-dependent oxidoreductase YjgC
MGMLPDRLPGYGPVKNDTVRSEFENKVEDQDTCKTRYTR